MQTLYYVPGVTGSGKTTCAMKYALLNPDTNFFFVLPSRQLIDEKLREIRALRGDQPRNIKAFYHDDTGTSVVKRIAEFIEATPKNAGAILLITHKAFAMMRKWHNRAYWHGFVDEVPDVSYAFCEPLIDHRYLLLDKLQFSPDDNPRYLRVTSKASCAEEVRRIAVNQGNDAVNRIFQELCDKLADDSDWHVFWEKDQVERFRCGEISQPALHGILHPAKFDGFASLTFLAADWTDSLPCLIYRNRFGVNFRVNRRVTKMVADFCASKGIRHDQHVNGSRLTILKFSDRPWSKTAAKLPVAFAGETYAARALFCQAVEERTKGIAKLWIGNNDVPNGTLDGVRLPGIPHGFNQYSNYNCCVSLSALLPDPPTMKFLQDMAGITTRQVRRAIGSQIAYQAMGRGKIRNPEAADEYLCIVPDDDTMSDIAAKYPGCTQGFLMGYDPLPSQKTGTNGRPKLYLTDEARQAARAEQFRVASRKYRINQKNLRVNNSLLVQGGYDGVIEGAKKTLIEALFSHTRHDLQGLADELPDYTGMGGFALSYWRNIYDKVGSRPPNLLMETSAFQRELKRCQGFQFSSKRQVELISPAVFDAELSPETNRGTDNAISHRGLILDIENSKISPEEFHVLYPEYQMLIYSSYNHTKERPRYRVCIPTTHYVDSRLHQMMLRSLLQPLLALGFGDANSARPHGFDTGKFNSSAMFYLPSYGEDMFLYSHLEEGRKPLNPMEWLKTAPDSIWDDCIELNTPDKPVEYSPVVGYSARQKELFDAVTHDWQMHGPGQGNREFNRAAWRLKGLGMSIDDVESWLHEQYSRGNGDAHDRCAQIPYVVNGLRRAG